ncbi:MAG: undecaprenyldiphospho-muramoylpentapeptide beta-N-acetylglucosaminyltransferase [Methylophilaceae bacterium 17-44-8]|nr:MAG: undecaprenyldiphospho-muramoylpentapeptide beta-N-acetylglucosaminyltransferase [Methylophilales bacterium 16-45-7]OZA07024.1 MAG: undecaprenyldiphospho-muramoylpentapeptide beta-N-acetylglucosaminyltransferase [Methylophilaceae bacterium 17-44-8]
MMLDNVITRFDRHTILIMAGGTGGHVYPAMAVADYLKAHGWQVVWLATEGGMENRLVEGKGYVKAMMTMQGVRGKGLKGWLLLPVKLAKALLQAKRAIQAHKPNVVLGMGGFAAFPGGVMAKLMGKPLIVHEQNSVAGLTNKVLSLFADRVLVAFPNVLGDESILVGNPVRQDLLKVAPPEQRFANKSGKLKLLVVGGSLGAAALNEVLPKVLAEMTPEERPEVIHQAGEKHIEALKQHYQSEGVQADARPFIQNMAEVYTWADVVICRAGALTVAELACVGVASVLVPFPFAVDDHQTTNGKYLADNGAAILVQQSAFDVTKATELLRSFTREKCLSMAINAKKLAQPDATTTVAKICMECALTGA